MIWERNKLNALLIYWKHLNQFHVVCFLKSSISNIQNLCQMNMNINGRYLCKETTEK